MDVRRWSRALASAAIATLFLTVLFSGGRSFQASLPAFSVLVLAVVVTFHLSVHLLRFLLRGRFWRSADESLWFSVGLGAALLAAVCWVVAERELLQRPWFKDSSAKRLALAIAVVISALLGSWLFLARSRPLVGAFLFLSLSGVRYLPEAFLYPLPETRWLLLVGFALASVVAVRQAGLPVSLAVLVVVAACSFFQDQRSEHVLKTTLLDVWPTARATNVVNAETAREAKELFGRRSTDEVLSRLPAPALRRRWNLLWITLCTSRADHFGFLGSTQGLTPAIDHLAKGSVVFERAYAPAPASAGSIAAMFRGWYPTQCPEVDGKEADSTWLPTVLARSGMSSQACSSFGLLALRAPFRSLIRGFEDHGPKQWFGRIAAPEVVAAFSDSLGRGDERPWFRWIFLMDAHAPYQGDPEADSLPSSEEVRYAAGLRVLDRAVDALWKRVEESGQANTTVLIVHGDHGESLGEHGIMGHATGIHDAQIRVPLFLRLPGGTSRRVAAPVDLVDLAPSVHEILALPGEVGGPGDSLVPWLLGDDLPSVAVSRYHVVGAPSAARTVMVGGDGRKTVVHGRFETAEVFDLTTDAAERAPQREPERARRDGDLLRVVLDHPVDHFRRGSGTEAELLPLTLGGLQGTEGSVALDLLRSPHEFGVAELTPALQFAVQEAPLLVLQHLPGLFGHRETAVRARTIESLPPSFLLRSVHQVRAATEDPEERVRLAALAAIARAPKGFAPADVQLRVSGTGEERRARALALASLGAPDELQALLADTEQPGEEQLFAWFTAAQWGDARAQAFAEALARDVAAPMHLRLQAYLRLLRAGLATPIECAIELQSNIGKELLASAANERDPTGAMPIELLLQFALSEDRTIALHALTRLNSQLQASNSGITPRDLMHAWLTRTQPDSKRLLAAAGVHPRFSGDSLPGSASVESIEWVGPRTDLLSSSFARVRLMVREPGALNIKWHDPVTATDHDACVLWLPEGAHVIGLPAPGIRDPEVRARLQLH